MNPAEAIQANIGGTQRAVAELVGETPQSWGQYIAGKQSPSADKVAQWCERADVALLVHYGEWQVMAEETGEPGDLWCPARPMRPGG